MVEEALQCRCLLLSLTSFLFLSLCSPTLYFPFSHSLSFTLFLCIPLSLSFPVLNSLSLFFTLFVCLNFSLCVSHSLGLFLSFPHFLPVSPSVSFSYLGICGCVYSVVSECSSSVTTKVCGFFSLFFSFL